MTTDQHTTTGRGRAALTARARLDHAETKLAAATRERDAARRAFHAVVRGRDTTRRTA